MPRIDIRREISQNRSNCKELLERFREANLSSQDFSKSIDVIDGFLPLHEILRSCEGEGVSDVIEYVVNLHPDGIKLRDTFGNLPLHVLPLAHSQQETDQQEARLFLMKTYPEAVKKRNNRGETPLVKAIRGGYSIIVKGIVDEFPEAATEPDEDGKFLIHHAIENFDEMAVKLSLSLLPEAISILDEDGTLSMTGFIPGKAEDTQRVLAAIAEALPETFEVDCNCREKQNNNNNNNDLLPCNCQISKSLIIQFFKENQLTRWGVTVLWRLMKTSLYRKQLALPEKVFALETELGSVKAQLEETQRELSTTKKDLKWTKEELSNATEESTSAMEEMELHKALAQEQNDKYLVLAMKMQTLQENRNFNSESKFLSKIDNEWSVTDLKAILQSLVKRLEYLMPENTKLSMAQISASYLLEDEKASKEFLIDTIEALNKELLEL